MNWLYMVAQSFEVLNIPTLVYLKREEVRGKTSLEEKRMLKKD